MKLRKGDKMEEAYFITADWCNQGRRGVFCSKNGDAYRKDKEPHTKAEMLDILGPFFMILSPSSDLFTKKNIEEYNHWIPLEEYHNFYGIATMAEVEEGGE